MKKFNRVALALLGLAVSLGLAQDALAQRQGRGFRGFGNRTTTRYTLATLEAVQNDLKLTDEQKKLATDLVADAREERQALGRDAAGDYAKFTAKLEKEFLAKLDAAQQQRLHGLFVQANGAAALSDAMIAETVGISEEQAAQLKTAGEENANKMREAFQDFRDMTPEERTETFTKLGEESTKSLMAVLTDAQKQKLEDLKGEALEMDLASLRGRGRRGGGGGGGGGPQGRPPRDNTL